MDISSDRQHWNLSVSSYSYSESAGIYLRGLPIVWILLSRLRRNQSGSALLAGHPLSATWYHPLVTYTVVIFGGFMLTQTLARLHIGGIKGWKFHEWHLYAAVAIMIGNFILKNILLLGFHISL